MTTREKFTVSGSQLVDKIKQLIHEGNIAAACQQLYDAYCKTDGQPQPPDFVKGSAAPELASKMLKLMQTLNWKVHLLSPHAPASHESPSMHSIRPVWLVTPVTSNPM